jgi:hypothetical protein
VDTTHTGFSSVERAALFANGVGPVAIETLWLDEGTFVLELTNGRHVEVSPAEIVVWCRPLGAESLPDVAGFERVRATPRHLSQVGLDGEFEPREFRVLTETIPEKDVDVQITVDLQRDLLRVAVLGTRKATSSSPIAEPASVFGLVPLA